VGHGDRLEKFGAVEIALDCSVARDKFVDVQPLIYLRTPPRPRQVRRVFFQTLIIAVRRDLADADAPRPREIVPEKKL
jgi:hypothetical protein